MWHSGCLFSMSFTVSTALLINSSFEDDCSRSFVPVWSTNVIGDVNVVFLIIDFACDRVGHLI